MSDFNETISAEWEELKIVIETSALDVAKGTRGNISALSRVRRNLRDIRKRTTSILRVMIEQSRALESEKEAVRTAKKAAKAV